MGFAIFFTGRAPLQNKLPHILPKRAPLRNNPTLRTRRKRQLASNLGERLPALFRRRSFLVGFRRQHPDGFRIRYGKFEPRNRRHYLDYYAYALRGNTDHLEFGPNEFGLSDWQFWQSKLGGRGPDFVGRRLHNHNDHNDHNRRPNNDDDNAGADYYDVDDYRRPDNYNDDHFDHNARTYNDNACTYDNDDNAGGNHNDDHFDLYIVDLKHDKFNNPNGHNNLDNF